MGLNYEIETNESTAAAGGLSTGAFSGPFMKPTQKEMPEGLNLVSKKKYQDKIYGDYPDGDGQLIQYWDNGHRKFTHRIVDDGLWWKETYDENGNPIYYEHSTGYWEKQEYNENGNCIYIKDSDGYWTKREYDGNGDEIYYENSDGVIRDNRPQNINEGLNLVSKKKPNKTFKLTTELLPILNVCMYGTVLSPDNFVWDTENLSNRGSEMYWEYFDYGVYTSRVFDGASEYIKEYILPDLINLGVVDIVPIKIVSPRYYNYSCDILYFDLIVAPSFEETMLGDIRINSEEISEFIGEKYKSYSGFISYMPKTIIELIEAINNPDENERGVSAYLSFKLRDRMEEWNSHFYEFLNERYSDFDFLGNNIPEEILDNLYNELNGETVDWETENNDEENINEGLNLVSKKKYQDKIEGNYPDGKGSLTQYWNNGNVKFEHHTFNDGSWYKETFDENEKSIYYENSNGYWLKCEYSENGNVIYYETSNGYVEDNRPQNINEGLNLVSKKKYPEKIEGNYPDGEGQLIQYWDNGNIKFSHDKYPDGIWYKSHYNENGDEIYVEASDGHWCKKEYDENGKQIYYSDSYGGWAKYEYDENGNLIYYEDSDGIWSKREYDENGNEIYYEDSDGEIRDNRPQNINEGLNLVLKVKKKYREEIEGNYPDGYGLLTQYWDNGYKKFLHRTFDDGSWWKFTYDENGYLIYYEDSDGEIRDNRPQNINEGLNLVLKSKKDKFALIMYRDGANYKTFFNVKIEPELYSQIEFDKLGNLIPIEFEIEDFGISAEDMWEATGSEYDDDIDHNIVDVIKLYDEEPINGAIDLYEGLNLVSKVEMFKIFNAETDEFVMSVNNKQLNWLIDDDWVWFSGLKWFTFENRETLESFLVNTQLLNEGLNLVLKERNKMVIDWYDHYKINERELLKFVGELLTRSDLVYDLLEFGVAESHTTYSIGYKIDPSCLGVEKKINLICDEIQNDVEGISDTVQFDILYPDEDNDATNMYIVDFFLNFQKPIKVQLEPLNEGLNLVSKKKYREKIIGNYPDGYGSLIQYWDNGKRKFSHRTYDDGLWSKRYYDENENEIYYDHSSGYWEKREYDENGNLIYYENSHGYIEDNRSQNINEGLNLPKKKYQDKIEGNYPDGSGKLTQYWDNGNRKFVHRTYKDGSWRKREYNENGNPIYYEDFRGHWAKHEYDENGNEIYFENSHGVIIDRRPQNINEGLNLVLKPRNRLVFDEIRQLLVDWLIDGDYSLDSAEEQIDNAKITIDGRIVTIVYGNGVIDVVKIETDNKIIHIS